MWIKLTLFDGTPCRVNTDNLAAYYAHIDGEAKTFLEYPVSGDTMQGLHVRETVEQIDAITKPVYSGIAVENKSGWS